MRMAKALIDGTELKAGMQVPGYGELRVSETDSKTVIMAEPIRFTRENIDSFDFGI